MDKMNAAIKKVERYESKLKIQIEIIEEQGIDSRAFWASYPAGSKERRALFELGKIQTELRRARNELSRIEKIEMKEIEKFKQKKSQENSSLWMQSKSGMWHKYVDNFEVAIASCQSYNLDRINELYGDALSSPPDGAQICKKCLSKNSGKVWR